MPINDNADKSLLKSRAQRLSESANDYPYLVVDFGDGFRVIECVAGIQWIVQRPSQCHPVEWSVLLSHARGAVALFRPSRSSGAVGTIRVVPRGRLQGRAR